jgi:hypothetical protein
MLRNVEVKIAVLLTSIPKVHSSIYFWAGEGANRIQQKVQKLAAHSHRTFDGHFLQSVTEYRCQGLNPAVAVVIRRLYKICPVAVFIVPDWGMQPDMASGCHTGRQVT